MNLPFNDPLSYPREAAMAARDVGSYRHVRRMVLRMMEIERNSIRLGMPRKREFNRQYLANLRVARAAHQEKVNG